MRPLANGSACRCGATIAMLARGSAARLRPCSARLDTHSTGSPPSSPYVTNDAHGSPSALSVASVPVLVDAAIVRASSAADGRTELAISVSGGGTDGASPGSPWSRDATPERYRIRARLPGAQQLMTDASNSVNC